MLLKKYSMFPSGPFHSGLPEYSTPWLLRGQDTTPEKRGRGRSLSSRPFSPLLTKPMTTGETEIIKTLKEDSPSCLKSTPVIAGCMDFFPIRPRGEFVTWDHGPNLACLAWPEVFLINSSQCLKTRIFHIKNPDFWLPLKKGSSSHSLGPCSHIAGVRLSLNNMLSAVHHRPHHSLLSPNAEEERHLPLGSH